MRAPLVAAAMGSEGDLVDQRLGRGCQCYAVWIDGSLAGYGWLSTGAEWIGEVQLEIKPRSKEGYIWNCVTVPGQRRRGVFRSLVWGMSSAGRRLGLRRLWIGSVAIPAEKALGPAGFRPALHFKTQSMGPLTWLAITPPGETALAAEACSVLGVSRGIHLRRTRRRRH